MYLIGMKTFWANTILLALVVVELVSGFFGLVSGSAGDAVFIVVHRIGGFAILVVLVWKTAIIVSSVRRRRSGPRQYASLTLAALLVVTLGLGFAWSYAGPFTFGWFSGVSWHIYVGAALVPVLAWHAIIYTKQLPLSFWAERRWFLRLAGITVAGLAFTQAAEAVSAFTRPEGSRRRFTGSYDSARRYGRRFPVVSWLNDRPPDIDADKWRLVVSGAVERELSLGYSDLEPTREVVAVIDCTGGWYSEQSWRGVGLGDVIDRAGPGPRATSVTVTSASGYYRRFSMAEAREYILATDVVGVPLSRGHGYPLRLVAPGKRGFEWVKWVTWIEVNESPKWLQPPLPLQ